MKERVSYGKEMREMFAQCCLELKNNSYQETLSLTVTEVIVLTQTSEWQNADKKSLEQQRFEAILSVITGAANSITKTIGNACQAIIKTIAGR